MHRSFAVIPRSAVLSAVAAAVTPASTVRRPLATASSRTSTLASTEEFHLGLARGSGRPLLTGSAAAPQTVKIDNLGDPLANIPLHRLDARTREKATTLLTTLLLPAPIPAMIRRRTDLHSRLMALSARVAAGCDLDRATFEAFDSLQAEVRSLGTGRGVQVKDPSWGLDPELGLVDERECREYLRDELDDGARACVREIGQLCVYGLRKARA